MQGVTFLLAALLCLAVVGGWVLTAETVKPSPTGPAAGPVEQAPASGGEKPAADSAAPSYEEVMKDPNRKVGFLPKKFVLPDKTERMYQVWIPLDYTPKQKWPTILFLHGKGECGTDGEKVLKHGLPKEIAKREGKFDFIVVIPQSTGGWSGDNEDVAIGALKAVMKEYAVAPDRIYLTGLSMGGFGAFQLAEKYNYSFAAVAPIAGGADPDTASKIRHIPMWIWHGSADPTVKVDSSRKIVEALVKAKAAELRYTELPGVKHNSWDTAYADDTVWNWLLEHKVSNLKSRRQAVPPRVDAPDWKEAPKTPAPRRDGAGGP